MCRNQVSTADAGAAHGRTGCTNANVLGNRLVTGAHILDAGCWRLPRIEPCGFRFRFGGAGASLSALRTGAPVEFQAVPRRRYTRLDPLFTQEDIHGHLRFCHPAFLRASGHRDPQRRHLGVEKAGVGAIPAPGHHGCSRCATPGCGRGEDDCCERVGDCR